MDTLGSIIEVIRDYLNRCVKCSKCRQGTCPWICNFLTPEASAITENADQKTTHEARAMALYEMAGCPCEQQLTFDDFIDRIDSFASKAKMPENGAELFATLRTLEEFPSRLGRMTKGARLAFADAIYCAIEHTLAALDYYYLRHGHCIKELLQQVHPSYDREEMFKLTGKIKSFTDKLIKKAKPLILPGRNYQNIINKELVEILLPVVDPVYILCDIYRNSSITYIRKALKF